MRECESKLYRRIAGGNKEKRGQASTVKRSGPSVGAGVGGRHCRRGVVSVLFGEIRAVSGRNRRHGRRGRQRVVSLADVACMSSLPGKGSAVSVCRGIRLVPLLS